MFSFGIWGYVGIALALLAAGAAGDHYITSRVYQAEISDLEAQRSDKQAADATVSLNQLKRFISQMHVASADYQDKINGLDTKLDSILGDFHDAIKKTPLPPDCKPDSERVRELSAAVAAINYSLSRPNSGETLPADPKTDGR